MANSNNSAAEQQNSSTDTVDNLTQVTRTHLSVRVADGAVEDEVWRGDDVNERHCVGLQLAAQTQDAVAHQPRRRTALEIAACNKRSANQRARLTGAESSGERRTPSARIAVAAYIHVLLVCTTFASCVYTDLGIALPCVSPNSTDHRAGTDVTSPP